MWPTATRAFRTSTYVPLRNSCSRDSFLAPTRTFAVSACSGNHYNSLKHGHHGYTAYMLPCIFCCLCLMFGTWYPRPRIDALAFPLVVVGTAAGSSIPDFDADSASS